MSIKKLILLLFFSSFICLSAADDLSAYGKGKQALKNEHYAKAYNQLGKVSKRSQLREYALYHQINTAIKAKSYPKLKNFLYIGEILNENSPHKEDLYTLQQISRFIRGIKIPNKDKIKCGKYLYGQKEFELAQKVYIAVPKTSKDYYKARYGLAQTYYGQGKYSSGRKILHKLPYSSKKLYWLGKCSGRIHRVRYYKKLVTRFPNSHYAPDALIYLFYHYKKYKNTQRMLQYLRQLQLHKKYANLAFFEKGYVYYRLKKYNYALKNFSYVKSDSYYHPAALYWKGKVQKRLGYTKSAAKTFQKLQQQHPFSFYSYRVFQNTGQKPVLKIYPKTLPANPPSTAKRLKMLLQEKAYEDAYYEVKNFHKEDKDLWIYLAHKLEQAEEYPFLVRITQKVNSHYYKYPLAYLEEIIPVTEQYPVDPYLAMAIMRQESSFDKEARSWCNAQGLMQLMPSTAEMCAKRLRIDKYHLFDPKPNILFGTYYLSSLITAYHSQVKAIAAYNCGPGNLATFTRYKDMDLYIEEIPIKETRNYVKKVLGNYWAYQLIYKEKLL